MLDQLRGSTARRFALSGEGQFGVTGRFHFRLRDEEGRILAQPALSIILLRTRPRAVARYEVTGVRGGTEAFWMRAEAVPGSKKLLVTGFRSASQEVLSDQRDRELCRAAIESFFSHRLKFDRIEAVNSLTYHLALGGGLVEDTGTTTMTEVWFRAGRLVQPEAQRYVHDLPRLMHEAIELANAAEEHQAQMEAKARAGAQKVEVAAFTPPLGQEMFGQEP